jgi:predicted nucleotide-binding protein (sugar kinase/HSP70/actin superfamily)
MIRVGIPRALLYYQYYPMWSAFLGALGAEVVVSPPTTKREVSNGISRMVAETCLPVKVFCGHVQALADKCDYLFIPSVRSMEPKVFNCSKFLGLPDMIKATVPEAPPILDADIDVNNKRGLYQAIYSLARPFTLNPLKIKRAVKEALKNHWNYITKMSERGLIPPQVIDKENPPLMKDYKATIAVVGHPYLLYDEYVNHRLLHRLQRMGVRVLTPEMIPQGGQEEAIAKLEGKSYWTYEGEVVGAAGYYLDKGVDGIIGVAAFGCGPDSLMMDLVKRYARQKRKPFLCLTIDEHTAEAALLTRLEAFLDMLLRKKRCE